MNKYLFYKSDPSWPSRGQLACQPMSQSYNRSTDLQWHPKNFKNRNLGLEKLTNKVYNPVNMDSGLLSPSYKSDTLDSKHENL